MLGMTIGLIVCALLAFVLIRFGYRNATTLWELAKYVLVAAMIATFLLFIAAFSCSNRDYNNSLANLPPLTKGPSVEGASERGRLAVIAGTVSTDNDVSLGTDYVAYVTYEDDGITSDRPDLLIELSDGTVIEVEQGLYEPVEWHSAEGAFETTAYLQVGDPVIAGGTVQRMSVRSNGETFERELISSPFIYRGEHETFDISYAQTLRRTATYAQILSTTALIGAGIILLSPLPHAVHLMRSGREKRTT